jgi:hypothetical protein
MTKEKPNDQADDHTRDAGQAAAVNAPASVEGMSVQATFRLGWPAEPRQLETSPLETDPPELGSPALGQVSPPVFSGAVGGGPVGSAPVAGTAPTVAGTPPIPEHYRLEAETGAFGLKGFDAELVLEQIPAAAQFTDAGEGPIDLVPDPPSSKPVDEAEQRIHYAEARDKLVVLQTLGSNVLGGLEKSVGKTLAAMPEDLASACVVSLWHGGNGLRVRLSAHDEALMRQRAASLSEPDPALLEPAAVGPLRDFVSSFNLFIAGDLKGRELERKQLNPEERALREKSVHTFQLMLDALGSESAIITPDAYGVLTEIYAAAEDAPSNTLGTLDVALAFDSFANFLAALRRKIAEALKTESAIAWKTIREGAYRQIGSRAADVALLSPFAIFWITYHDQITALLKAFFR